MGSQKINSKREIPVRILSRGIFIELFLDDLILFWRTQKISLKMNDFSRSYNGEINYFLLCIA